MHTLTPSDIPTHTGRAVLVERVWRTCAKVDDYGGLSWRSTAHPLPIAGPLAAVGGVVTVRGRLPVTVPRRRESRNFDEGVTSSPPFKTLSRVFGWFM